MVRRAAANLALYGVWFWIGLLSPAFAQHICWIKSVVKTSYGVDIYFSQARKVFFHHAGSSQPLDVEPSNALPAVLGDGFLSMNTPNDTCSGEVVQRSGDIGVEITGAFHPPGLPGNDITNFIAAEPGTRD